MAIGTTDNPDGDNVAAGSLTRDEVKAVLTEPLEQQSRFLKAGPTIYDTDGNTIRVPSAPAASVSNLEWVGENEQIPEVDPEFGETVLLPSEMKSVKTLTRFSNELARQSVVGLDQALQSRLVTDVAGKIDAQFLSDSGDGKTKPKGLFAYTEDDGVQTQEVDDWDIDAIMDAQGLALAAHVNPDSLALFIRPDDYMAIRRRKDGEERYLLTADPRDGGLVVPILGAKVYVSDRVPEDHAAVVDMSQIAVARDLATSVKVLDQTFGDYDQQAIRVISRMDMKPVNPEAVILLSKSAS